MKLMRLKVVKNYLPQTVLVLSLLGLYLYTLAPGLTWANSGSDGGDLITAAATGGIPHPSGYPLYLLLARLFQYLPIGNIAFRTNLMSAVCTCLAGLLIFEIVTRSVIQQNQQPWLVGLVSACAFGLAPLIWSQSVITEVYALQSLLIALILYLYAVPVSASGHSSHRIDYVRGLALGLAASNHVTAVLIFPMALALGSIYRAAAAADDSHRTFSSFHNLRFDLSSLRRQCIGLMIGLSPYLILPLRALTHPPVNWGNPVTLQSFWWLVSGKLYQSYYFQSSFADILRHGQAAAILLFEQFGFVAVVIGVLGLIVFGLKSRLYALTLWIALTHIAFASYYGTEDSYLYLIPVFACFAIWIGFGVDGLIHYFVEQAVLQRALFQTLILAYLILRAFATVSDVDASHDLRAESFGREVLSAAPQDAILFATGDRAIFSLWYFHFALRERPDLTILAADLLHFDWYQENIHEVYPSLKVAEPFPWPETIARANPSRPVCTVQYTYQTVMECSEGVPAP